MTGWNGDELMGAEAYLQETANDPDSIEVRRCTRPVLTRTDCWTSTCQVRERNAFNALVLNRVIFSVGRDEHIILSRYVTVE